MALSHTRATRFLSRADRKKWFCYSGSPKRHRQGKNRRPLIRELLDARDRRIELGRRIREVEARLTPQPPQEQPYQPDPFIDPSAFAPASRGGSARSEARGRIANLATLVVTATDGAMSRVRMQLDIDRLSPGSP